jgi:hypothetical protein
VRISPGVGVRTIAKVPLRRGEIDTEFDQEELAKLLDQQPFNLAVANLYKTRFNGWRRHSAPRASRRRESPARRPSGSSLRSSRATSAGRSTC